MAKTWRNRSSTFSLKGFDEFYEKLEKAGKDAETESKKLFEQSVETMRQELYNKSKAAGVEPHLLNQITVDKIINAGAGWWEASVGWKKSKRKNPLPDTYKVMFYNYGTPSKRYTKEGGQRIQLDGKWVTLSKERGREPTKGFIRRAKLAAARKNKKLREETFKKIMGDLK